MRAGHVRQRPAAGPTSPSGRPPPPPTWYLAEGCTDGGMETWVLVQNPNAAAVTVDLTLMTDSGRRWTRRAWRTWPSPQTPASPSTSATTSSTYNVSTKVRVHRGAGGLRAGHVRRRAAPGPTTPSATPRRSAMGSGLDIDAATISRPDPIGDLTSDGLGFLLILLAGRVEEPVVFLLDVLCCSPCGEPAARNENRSAWPCSAPELQRCGRNPLFSAYHSLGSPM